MGDNRTIEASEARLEYDHLVVTFERSRRVAGCPRPPTRACFDVSWNCIAARLGARQGATQYAWMASRCGSIVLSPMLKNPCSTKLDVIPGICQYRPLSQDTSFPKRTCLSIIGINTKLLLDFTNTATTLLGNKSHQLSANVFDVIVLLKLFYLGFDLCIGSIHGKLCTSFFFCIRLNGLGTCRGCRRYFGM